MKKIRIRLFVPAILVMFLFLFGVAMAEDTTEQPAKKETIVNVKGRTFAYNGEEIHIDEPEIIGSTGKVTYTYYLQHPYGFASHCTELTTAENAGAKTKGGAPCYAGRYQVRIQVESDDEYEAADVRCDFNVRPGKVTGVTVAPSDKGVKISWKKMPGADGYVIYSKNGKYFKEYSEYRVVKGRNARSIVIKNVVKGQKFKVAAFVDDYGLGVVGPKSKKAGNVFSISLSVSNTKNGMLLSWERAEDAKGYDVYRKTGKEKKFKKVASFKTDYTTRWTDKNSKIKKDGTKVQYYVKVVFGKKTKLKGQSKTVINYFVTTPVAKRKGEHLVWNKIKGAKAYEVSYSRNFTPGTHYHMSMNDTMGKITTKKTKVKNHFWLGEDTYSYVGAEVRAYKIFNGKKYYSGWSKSVQRWKNGAPW